MANRPLAPEPWMSFTSFAKRSFSLTATVDAMTPPSTFSLEEFITDIWTEYGGSVGSSSAVDSRAAKQPDLARAIDITAFHSYLTRLGDSYDRFKRHVEEFKRLKSHYENPQVDEMARKIHEIVPAEYFAPIIDLSSERVFSNLAVQSAEVLSYYLDQVEVVLARHVSLKADEFYQAAALYRDLLGLVNSISDVIKDMRASLESLHTNHVEQMMLVLHLRRKRDVLYSIHGLLSKLSAIHDAMKTVTYLYSRKDYLSAFDMIEHSMLVLREELSQLEISKMLLSSLRVLRQKMYKDVVEDCYRIYSSEKAADEEIDPSLFAVLFANSSDFMALVARIFQAHTDRLEFSFRKAVADCACLVVSDSSTSASKTDIASFTWDQFEFVFSSATEVVVGVLDRFRTVVRSFKFLMSSDSSEDELNTWFNKSVSDASQRIIQEAYEQLASMLSRRQEAHARMALAVWLKLLKTVEDFNQRVVSLMTRDADSSGVILMSSEKSLSLPKQIVGNVLLAQMRAFTDTFHSKRMADLSLLIENELWTLTEIPSEFRDLLAMFAAPPPTTSTSTSASASVDAAESGAPHSSDALASRKEGAPLPSAGAPSGGSAATGGNTKYLEWGGEKRPMTSVLLMLLKMVREYCDLIRKFPAVIQVDAIQKLGELLKLYNTKTCQMILGTGAMQGAGLKSITVKHIALSAENITFMIDFCPKLVSYIRSFVGPKEGLFLRDVDSAVRDFGEHRKELLRKIVSIMRDRLDLQVKTADTLLMDNAPEEGAVYIRSIVKETHTLYKVVSPIMTSSYVHILMSTVVQLYSKRFADLYGRLLTQAFQNQENAFGRSSQKKLGDRIRRDIEFLKREAQRWGQFEEEWRPLVPFEKSSDS
eukprot:ANDGO_01435.mRNA.1 Vacuolar protein sorting-associated protein 54